MKMWFFYLIMSVYWISTKAGITPICPPETIQSHYDNKICYLFVNESKNFADGESYCNGKGGNLAVVPSQFVNIFLSSEAFEKFGSFVKYWIGGTIKTVKMNAASSINVWGWTKDDRLMTFSDWDPTTTSTGNCTTVQSSTLWSAIDCSLKSSFVCEIPADVSSYERRCDDGWTHLNLTNSCYKKISVKTGINQSDAENSCIQKGGHLASIHSAEENQFIDDLTSIGYKTHVYASAIWIGVRRNDNSYNWYWTDNSKFNFTNWGNSYDYTNCFCTEFLPDWTTNYNNSAGQWNAGNCYGYLYGYLCKKPPHIVAID